jgi:hypothetical protein
VLLSKNGDKLGRMADCLIDRIPSAYPQQPAIRNPQSAVRSPQSANRLTATRHMRRSFFALPAAALLFAGTASALLFAGTALAQAKPNFAGKWTIIRDSAAVQLQGLTAGAPEMGGLSNEATITQDEKTLSVKRPTPNMGEFTSVFNLDGTETYSTVTIGGQQIPLTLKSRWDGKKLITSTWANVGNGQQIEIILNFSLDDKGNLVTEHIVPPMGPQMMGGTLVTKYKKN